MTRAIYPGTFDPLTYGHLDILKRACGLFDQVIVVVGNREDKNPLLTMEERVALWQIKLKSYPQARVEALEGLMVNYAKQLKAKVLIRGLRVLSDFEYEFQMARMNRQMDPDIETIFLMPSEKYFYTSSCLVKSVAAISLHQASSWVPPEVLEILRDKYAVEAPSSNPSASSSPKLS